MSKRDKTYSKFHVLGIVSKYVAKEIIEQIEIDLAAPRKCLNCDSTKRVIYGGICHGCYNRWYNREQRKTKTIKGKRGSEGNVY